MTSGMKQKCFGEAHFLTLGEAQTLYSRWNIPQALKGVWGICPQRTFRKKKTIQMQRIKKRVAWIVKGLVSQQEDLYSPRGTAAPSWGNEYKSSWAVCQAW